MTSPSDRHRPDIDVRDAARLARISLPAARVRVLNEDLARVRDFLSTLRQVDTEGVRPLLHLHEAFTPPREDTVTASLPREDALRNAPAHSDGFVRVPPVL